jgi:hypothetical protein
MERAMGIEPTSEAWEARNPNSLFLSVPFEFCGLSPPFGLFILRNFDHESPLSICRGSSGSSDSASPLAGICVRINLA